ncbi:hypothetical protein [Mesorhizobium sp. 43Arga]
MAFSVEWVSEGLRFSSPKEEPGGSSPTGGFIDAAALIGDPAQANRAWALTGSRTNGGEQRTLVLFDLSRQHIIAKHEFPRLGRGMPLSTRDGRWLYVPANGSEGEPYKPGWRCWPELSIIETETGRFENQFRFDLNFRFYGQQLAETADGRLCIPALTGSEPGRASTALITIDPKTGMADVAEPTTSDEGPPPAAVSAQASRRGARLAGTAEQARSPAASAPSRLLR